MPLEPINRVNSNQYDSSRQKKEAAAVGVGGAAGIAGSSKIVSNVKKGEPVFNGAVKTLKNFVSSFNKNSGTSHKLLSNFKSNVVKFSADIMRRLEKYNGSKLGKLIKLPVAKGLSTVIGGVLAFFVLVTGVNKAIDTGELAVGNMKLNKQHFLDNVA